MTMRSKLFNSLAAGFIIAGIAFASAQEGIPKETWRWAHFSAEAWGSSQADKLFVEEVKKRTNGRVTARFYWSGAMGGGNELLELTANGAVDVGSFVPAYYPGQMPLMSLVNSLPLTWADPVLAMETQKYLFENNKYVQQELEKNRVVPILFHGLAPYRLQCTKPVRRLADIKGLRVRSFGEWPPIVLQRLGAVPVNVGMTEVYEGLQRGSLDCAYLSIEAAGFFKIGEVAKYWSTINFGAIAAYSSFVSADKYQSWSPEFKKILKEAADVAEAYEKQEFAKLEQQTIEAAKKLGVEIVEFEEQDQLEAAIPNLLSEWEKTMCDRGQCEAAKSVVADIRKVMEERK